MTDAAPEPDAARDDTAILRFSKRVLDPRIWIDSKAGTLTGDLARDFRLSGWLKLEAQQTAEIHLMRADGSVLIRPLNKLRPDVKGHLDKHGAGVFSAECGFDLREDLSTIGRIGFRMGDRLRWEYDVVLRSAAEGDPLRLIFGPSHIYRLELAIRNRLIPEIEGRYQFVRKGGMPIWSPLVREAIRKTDCASMFFIVGDFRFGNMIFRDRIYPDLDPGVELNGIDKDMITPDNDLMLYRMCLQHLTDIARTSPVAPDYLFWDLSIRESENRSKVRYQQDGTYRHPVWNYDEVADRFGDRTVDSRDILPDGRLLYIDSSAHPSTLGFAYLWHKIHGRTDFDIRDKQRQLQESLSEAFATACGTEPVHGIGTSAFVRYMNQHAANGTIPLPANFTFQATNDPRDIKPVAHLIHFLPLRTFKQTDDQIRRYLALFAQQLRELRRVHGRVSVIPFDNWASEVTSLKPQYKDWYTPRSPIGRTAHLERVLCDADQSYRISKTRNPHKLLEINHVLAPNLFGVMDILMQATSDSTRAEVETAYERIIHRLYSMADPQDGDLR